CGRPSSTRTLPPGATGRRNGSTASRSAPRRRNRSGSIVHSSCSRHRPATRASNGSRHEWASRRPSSAAGRASICTASSPRALVDATIGRMISHEIIGDDMQAVVLTMGAGDEIRAEAGAMTYMTDGIEMDARMQGGLLGGLKRKILAGESFFLTYF